MGNGAELTRGILAEVESGGGRGIELMTEEDGRTCRAEVGREFKREELSDERSRGGVGGVGAYIDIC